MKVSKAIEEKIPFTFFLKKKKETIYIYTYIEMSYLNNYDMEFIRHRKLLFILAICFSRQFQNFKKSVKATDVSNQCSKIVFGNKLNHIIGGLTSMRTPFSPVIVKYRASTNLI